MANISTEMEWKELGSSQSYDSEPGSPVDKAKDDRNFDQPQADDVSETRPVEDMDEKQDLEAVQPVPSGRPAHSAFPKRKKQFIVFMAAFAGFFSPLTANIYFPALNTLSNELHVSNSLINLTLTTYMIFQGK